jgi:hypothetical protein
MLSSTTTMGNLDACRKSSVLKRFNSCKRNFLIRMGLQRCNVMTKKQDFVEKGKLLFEKHKHLLIFAPQFLRT